jgi:hypothetical protein
MCMLQCRYATNSQQFEMEAAMLVQQLQEQFQLRQRQAQQVSASLSSAVSKTKKKVMVVYMVGGLTYLEIAALRHLSRHPTYPYSIIMATTKLVNPNTLLAGMIESDLRF